MPHVVDLSLRIVFCEGRPGSLDDLLLGHILSVGQVLIQPVGGKYGMRAYIEGYLGNPRDTPPMYLGFRDRDFDVVPTEQPQLIRLQGDKPIWLCHRAAVENYMIDAELIWQYWTERENAPAWSHGRALAIEEIQNHICESVRDLADYQSVRWALASLKPGPRWPEIHTTWTKEGSGDIPASLAYDDCLDRAIQLIESFQEQIQTVDPGRLHERAEAYRSQFSSTHFMKEQRYLIWFHGKDHLAQLCRRLAPNFPRRHYSNWAAEHVDVSKHPDLQQLVSLTR